MFTVKISVLKNQLSAILRRVQKGEEVVILDRDQPIARLVRISSTSHQDMPLFMEQLIQRGIVKPAAKKIPNRRWFESRLITVEGVQPSQILIQEREESW